MLSLSHIARFLLLNQIAIDLSLYSCCFSQIVLLKERNSLILTMHPQSSSLL